MWQSLLPIAGNLLGGLFGNKSSKQAQNATTQGYQQGIGAIDGYYNDAKGYMNPYMQTGQQANSGIAKLLGGDYGDFYNSPDFQARMQAGGQMADNSAASRGGLFGGGHQRALTSYGQGLAAQGLGDYRNWLGGVAGQGQNAAMGLSQMGADAGRSIANLYGAQGEARASGYAQRGENNANMIGGIAGLFGGMGGKQPPVTTMPGGITPRTIGPYS